MQEPPLPILKVQLGTWGQCFAPVHPISSFSFVIPIVPQVISKLDLRMFLQLFPQQGIPNFPEEPQRLLILCTEEENPIIGIAYIHFRITGFHKCLIHEGQETLPIWPAS